MKLKSKVVGLVLATSIAALTIPSQAAWSMHRHCSGNGWHMVSKKCNIPVAVTWQEYDSGVYLPPQSKGFLFMR